MEFCRCPIEWALREPISLACTLYRFGKGGGGCALWSSSTSKGTNWTSENRWRQSDTFHLETRIRMEEEGIITNATCHHQRHRNNPVTTKKSQKRGSHLSLSLSIRRALLFPFQAFCRHVRDWKSDWTKHVFVLVLRFFFFSPENSKLNLPSSLSPNSFFADRDCNSNSPNSAASHLYRYLKGVPGSRLAAWQQSLLMKEGTERCVN